MKDIVKYLNLTNGLVFYDNRHSYKFVRIQSSLCESKAWDKLIRDLDYNFLLDLAQGKIVYVYDASSKKKMTRALYQGLAFIEYTLNRRWFNRKAKEVKAMVKGNNVSEYFEREYKSLSKDTKKKLDYVKKFLNTNKINLLPICSQTKHDGDYKYYKKILGKVN